MTLGTASLKKQFHTKHTLNSAMKFNMRTWKGLFNITLSIHLNFGLKSMRNPENKDSFSRFILIFALWTT